MAGGEASGSEAPVAAAPASKASRTGAGFDEITTMLGSPYVAANILLSSLYIAVRPFYVDKPIREGMLFMGDVHDFTAFERYVGFLCKFQPETATQPAHAPTPSPQPFGGLALRPIGNLCKSFTHSY